MIKRAKRRLSEERSGRAVRAASDETDVREGCRKNTLVGLIAQGKGRGRRYQCRTHATGRTGAAAELGQIIGLPEVGSDTMPFFNRFARCRSLMVMVGICRARMMMYRPLHSRRCRHPLMHRAAKKHGRGGETLSRQRQHHKPHQQCFRYSLHPGDLRRRLPNNFNRHSERQAYAEDWLNSNLKFPLVDFSASAIYALRAIRRTA